MLKFLPTMKQPWFQFNRCFQFGDSDADEISRVVLCVYQAGK